jgi:hypothetical protein
VTALVWYGGEGLEMDSTAVRNNPKPHSPIPAIVSMIAFESEGLLKPLSEQMVAPLEM